MAEEIPASKVSRFEPLSALWRVFAAPQTLMALMGLLALAVAVGTLIPQIPPQALDEPQAWLAVQSGLFARSDGFIRALGLYDIYHVLWFRLLLVLTGLTLFVWTVESADLAWRASGKGHWGADAFSFWGSHTLHASVAFSTSPDVALARLCDLLAEHGYRCVEVSDLPFPNLVASCRGLALWARAVTCGALLVVLAGLAIAGHWGWQGADWRPVGGESWAVDHGTPYGVRLDGFDPRLKEDSRLWGCRSEVTWLEDNEPVQQSVVSFGRPARFRGLAVRQVGYVPWLKMRAWDEVGNPVELQPAGEESGVSGDVEILFRSPEAQPLVLLPHHDDLVLALSFEPPGAEDRASLHVTLLCNGGTESQLLAVLYESGSVVYDTLEVEVDVAYRPILRVDYFPAMGLVVGGMVLALAALAVSWILVPHLVWIAVGPGEESRICVQMLALAGAGGDQWLPRLADQLGEVLADDI